MNHRTIFIYLYFLGLASGQQINSIPSSTTRATESTNELSDLGTFTVCFNEGVDVESTLTSFLTDTSATDVAYASGLPCATVYGVDRALMESMQNRADVDYVREVGLHRCAFCAISIIFLISHGFVSFMKTTL